MTQLVRYEQARQALAECHKVDEVKDIRDKAEAMAAYARQAKDQELILWATEIKVRAERRAGEMLTQMPKNQGAKFNGRGPDGSFRQSIDVSAETLADVGVSPMQSSRWQALAAMPEEHFETAVATAKESAGQVTTAFMLREAQKHKPQGKPAKGPKADAMREELKKAQAQSYSAVTTYAHLLLQALKQREEVSQEELELLEQVAEAIHQLD